MNIMRTSLNRFAAPILMACATPAFAQSPPVSASHILGAASPGGGSGGSLLYSNRGGLGGFAAAPGTTSGAGGVFYRAASGDAWTQFDVVTLAASANPENVAEGETGQLTAVAVLEDDTTLELDSADLLWTLQEGPVGDIDAEGRFWTLAIHADQAASIRADYAGLSDLVRLEVLDRDPDNFGRYAKDGLPDAWQVRHFGEDNPEAMPDADPDGDEQDNSYEHHVGTLPNDAGSLFQLVIQSVTGKPDQKNLVFQPVWPDRAYTVQYQWVLGEDPFLDLEPIDVLDIDHVRIVTDLEAADPQKTYRVKIQFPSP